jgi:hypothetical protein
VIEYVDPNIIDGAGDDDNHRKEILQRMDYELSILKKTGLLITF